MTLRRAASMLTVAVAGLLVVPGFAQAAFPGANGPIVTLKPDLVTATIQSPSAVCFDKVTDELYVSSRSTTNPGVYAFDVHGDVPTLDDFFALPPGSVPQDMEFGSDGFLWVLDTGNDDIYKITPNPLQIVGTFGLPPGADRANGLAFGYRTDVLEYAGNADTLTPGGAFFGRAPNFSLGRSFGDTIFPNGVDLLAGIRGLRNARLPSEFAFYDAQNNDVLEVTDSAETPTVSDTTPGPPDAGGASPGTDLSVIPIDVDPKANGAGTLPLLVPVPNLGQIYESREPGKAWFPLLSTPFGRPVRIDSTCDDLAWTDFANNLVIVGQLDEPNKATCDDVFDLIALGFVASGVGNQASEFVVKMSPALAGEAKVKLELTYFIFGSKGSQRVRSALGRDASATLSRKVKAGRKKVRLRPGKVKKLKFGLSRAKSRAIANALRRGGRVKATLKIRLKSRAGERITIKRRTRIRSG